MIDKSSEGLGSIGLLFIIAVLVLMLFVPPFSDYFAMRWMDFGLGGAFIVTLILLAEDGPRKNDVVAALNWAILLAYLVHQFEEHGIDFRGQTYAFAAHLEALSGAAISPEQIHATNVLAVWLPGLLAVWGGRRLTWSGFALAGLLFVNGLNHIVTAIMQGGYNPGLVTSIVIFLPLSVFYYLRVTKEVTTGRIAAATIALSYGIGFHVLMGVLGGMGATPLVATVVLILLGSVPTLANVLYTSVRKVPVPSPGV